MASCWVLAGLVVLAVAFTASAVSFVAPYWYFKSGHTGLWAYCRTSDDCQWFFERDFQWEKAAEDWWYACQGLFGFGVLTLLFAFLAACINLCCGCCKGTMCISHLVAGCLIFAFVVLGVALALFGYKVHDERDIKIFGSDNEYRLMWAYWVGVGGAAFSLIAAFFYTCEGCRGHTHDGYTRGGVV